MLTAHGRMGGVIDWILNYKHIHHRRALSRPIYLQTRHRQDQINSPIQSPFQSGFSSPPTHADLYPASVFLSRWDEQGWVQISSSTIIRMPH